MEDSQQMGEFTNTKPVKLSTSDPEEFNNLREIFQVLREAFSSINQEVHDFMERHELMTQDMRALGTTMTEMRHKFDEPMDRFQEISEYPQSCDQISYEEEDCYTEDFLTPEDYAFAESIINPAYTGIYLSSTFPYFIDCPISPALALPILKRPHSVLNYSILLHDLFLLHNYYNFNSTIPIHNNNLYVIFVWDPGIF